ncbi:SASA domain-containing protein [Haematococcus lacustris]|uniref:SASA domain-containing protein n=1 Tax=Haematococcus lacustris TaxID=44745 RepID=A0A699ZB07_HAELA|nr:SASA domain-containing protein [Haematococcus lacustris]
MVNGTWAAMRAAGPAARLRGMLWVQGESDAYYPQDIVAAANYAANLRNFLAAVRKEFASLHPRLPVVVARQAVVNRDTLFPWIRIVRDQQDEVLRDPTQQPLPAVDMECVPIYTIA